MTNTECLIIKKSARYQILIYKNILISKWISFTLSSVRLVIYLMPVGRVKTILLALTIHRSLNETEG